MTNLSLILTLIGVVIGIAGCFITYFVTRKHIESRMEEKLKKKLSSKYEELLASFPNFIFDLHDAILWLTIEEGLDIPRHPREDQKYVPGKEKLAIAISHYLINDLEKRDGNLPIYLGPGTTTKRIGRELIKTGSEIVSQINFMTNNWALTQYFYRNIIEWSSPPGKMHIPNAAIDDLTGDDFCEWMKKHPPAITILGFAGFSPDRGFSAYSSMKCPARCAREQVVFVGNHQKLSAREGGEWFTFDDIQNDSVNERKKYLLFLDNPEDESNPHFVAPVKNLKKYGFEADPYLSDKYTSVFVYKNSQPSYNDMDGPKKGED